MLFFLCQRYFRKLRHENVNTLLSAIFNRGNSEDTFSSSCERDYQVDFFFMIDISPISGGFREGLRYAFEEVLFFPVHASDILESCATRREFEARQLLRLSAFFSSRMRDFGQLRHEM